jgi:hypothetical protein
MTKKLLVIAALSSVLLASGCGILPEPAPTASDAPSAAASETPSPAPTEPSSPPVAADATVVGTCTSTASRPTPTIYVAFTDDSTTEVTMSYMTFNADGTAPVVTETVKGPVVVRITYPCTDNSDSAMWAFTVSSGGSRIGCTQSFGGQIVDYDHAGEGTPVTADCTGHPGM